MIPAEGDPIASASSEAAVVQSFARLEAPMRAIAMPILAAFGALGVYAAFELRGLYADGANYLLRMIERGWFVFDDPPRKAVHLLQQLPVVVALRLGVTDTRLLGVLFGLAMYLVPLALLAICYRLLPRGNKAWFLFPLFHYLAGSQAAGFAGIVEAPVASAYFWFLLFLLVFRSPPSWALILAALPAALMHEVFVFLGPVLALAAWWRARAEAVKGTPAVYAVLGIWFLLIAASELIYVFNVPNPASRDSFIGVMLALGFLFRSDSGFTHGGINVTALMGIAAAVAVWLSGWRERRRGAIVAGLAMLCAVGIASPALDDTFLAPALQFNARSYGAILSLPLAAVLLLSLRRPALTGLWARPAVVPIIVVLAIGQLGWQALATWYWSRYIQDFEVVLSTHSALVSWPQALASLPPDRARLFSRFSWYWTNPTMSIVLAPRGKLTALLDNPMVVSWQPFDPTDANSLPAASSIDTSAYRAALADERKSASP